MKLRMLDEKLFGNNVGWWFRDDEESAELRDAINEVLAEMHKDGTTAEITEKYFYEDMTKLISDEWLHATH
jgi:putative amino-acid transport system substrate-binding protein